ncbi:hypothetical protein HD554DRAFT_2169035 [Boletus coccyginus]|nr:hypothetical protein HD554DRAFT_2169035 [Boletus coccyginus]
MLPDCVLGVVYTTTVIVAATFIFMKLSEGHKLGSWWAGHKFQTNAIEVIWEGYEKYKSVPFKVVDHYRWIVVLGGRQHINELRKAPDDTLLLSDAENDSIQMNSTMGPELLHNMYHVEVIHSHLTRNLSSLYPEIQDEILLAFEEVLDLRDNEWKSVHALSTIQKVVCRTSNRLFVRLPLCRDINWINLNLRYVLIVIEGVDTIQCFPGFLAFLVAHFMIDVLGTMKHAMRHLTPIIKGRLKLQEYGNDWVDKPNDLLS